MVRAAILATLCIAVAACSAPPAPASSIASAAPAIQKVEPSGDTEMVTARLKPGDDPNDSGKIEVSGAIARRIAAAIQNHASDLSKDATKLALYIELPTTDRLGNISDMSFIELDFSLSDLKAANIANLGTAGILNLSEPRLQISAARAVQNWCTLNRDKAPDFCEKGNMADRFDEQVKAVKQENDALNAITQ